MKRRARRLALSIRQPHAERVLTGAKTVEYRTMPTTVRGRIYIYASLKEESATEFGRAGYEPGSLPTGRIIGSVEIVECKKVAARYHWLLARARRLARPFRPTLKPQPVWFYPHSVSNLK